MKANVSGTVELLKSQTQHGIRGAITAGMRNQVMAVLVSLVQSRQP